MTNTTPYEVPALTTAEQNQIFKINNDPEHWGDGQALAKLQAALQIAVEVELATIPIYLYTYYSIDRTVGQSTPTQDDVFPKTPWSRFADKAGALIMSVVVEEMLHLSLSANVLHSTGKDPEIYGNSPKKYPAVLPGHEQGKLAWDQPIPLAKFSFDQLSHMLAIEYPAPNDAAPEGDNWETIGQLYSYVRCIISSKWITDSDFLHGGSNEIHPTEFSPNSIDTVFPSAAFDYAAPLPAPEPCSTATVAQYASDEDAHLGASELINIDSCEAAMEAIATITFQGEGFAQGAYDDTSKDELSHYYKFLTLQSELVGYTQAYIDAGVQHLKNNVAPLPAPPSPAAKQYGDCDLDKFVAKAPNNPVATNFTDGRGDLVDIADGLYQYMLIMTETIFRVPSDKQKIYFNRTMHQSMIWILDKFLKTLREVKTGDGQHTLCATFSNYPLGDKKDAFAKLKKMVSDFDAKYATGGTYPQDWYKKWGGGWLLAMIPELPDVSPYWTGAQPPANPSYLNSPSVEQGNGTGENAGARTEDFTSGKFNGVPKWPLTPPMDADLPTGAVRHTCMGLNSCKNQGRTSSNDCAGQGYCSTALAYNASDPKTPRVADHTCHVLNDCRSQGGCGLYGIECELANPGHNHCQSLGSCATPINAERFITDGKLRGQSVWQQARKVFTDRVWPGLVAANPDLHIPDAPPAVPHPKLFQYGPTIEWIESTEKGYGMTSCGSSGMSGAGSCS